jgi:hypothetical protein
MIYVYALAEPLPIDTSGIIGIKEQPIEVLTTQQAIAFYSESQVDRISPTAENLWRHELVVESLLKRCQALLPLRFGEVLSIDSLREILLRHGGSLASSLERVRDSVELGVRVLSPLSNDIQEAQGAVDTRAISSGRDYMRARLASEKKMRDAVAYSERLGKIIHSALAPLARECTRNVQGAAPAKRDIVITSAYLVRRAQVEEFVTRVRELSKKNPDLKVICTGPWPAYNFIPALYLNEATHG